jgi:hypothetical protein
MVKNSQQRDLRDGNALGRAKLYREQAAYCAALLRKVRDPGRKSLLEREFEDWLRLAERERAGRRSLDAWPRLMAVAQA